MRGGRSTSTSGVGPRFTHRELEASKGPIREAGKKTEERRSAHHTARKTSRHEREPDEQEQPRTPHRAGISKVLMSLHSVLVDEVDDDHSQEGTDAG